MKKELRILALEDSEDDVEIIGDTLTRAGLHFTTKRVDTKEEFLEALKNYKADVILSDHFLPSFNSLEALALYRETKLQIPFILVTGTISEEFAVNTLKQGADDYVLKTNLTRLPQAITNAIKQREAEIDKINANITLKNQYDELIKINKELDSFVYSVSHNLRAPLLSVLGLVNLAKIEDHKRDSFFSQYFRMMESSVHKLDETLKEILDYSRNVRQDLTIEEIKIKRIIADNLERVQHMPGSARITKKVTVNEKFPFYSDKYRISVIINNMVSNAIKYYDESKDDPYLHIYINVTKDFVDLHFEDNGIGISEEYISKVFDMFFRATQNNEGSGLGLYIVREALEKLKGEIKIESVVGEGTIFKIKIPNY